MARILITSGPTRQYLDPVRYLTNASSGRMGQALAAAALRAGHQVVVISGPVDIEYPAAAELIRVVSTEQMLHAAQQQFAACDGAIGVAAPCDYRPVRVHPRKISKTGRPLLLRLVETPDVVATLGASKRAHQWVVGFALETHDRHFRALRKLESKCCDLMVLNSPDAMHATDTQIEILDRSGEVIRAVAGPKTLVADAIMAVIADRLLPATGGLQHDDAGT